MTTTEALRKQAKKYVNKADEVSLRRVIAILEIDRQIFLETLPGNVKDDVEAGKVTKVKNPEITIQLQNLNSKE